MTTGSNIDVTFDFRTDTPSRKDPDAFSPTLRKYHRLLWSKVLPSGALFDLGEETSGVYLHHRSSLGEYFLASDSVVPSFRKERSLAEVIAQIPIGEWETFMTTTYTMGGMMVFPGNRVDRKMTINGARGCHPRIKDRFDLTVECIRRHYKGDRSPFADTLARYNDFFQLFESFRGYAEYFLLQDLVSADFSRVEFFTPFEDFTTSPLPVGSAAYRDYKQRAVEFIEARNERIRNAHQR